MVGLYALSAEPIGAATLRSEFIDPPAKYSSRPLWFWNGKLDEDKTRRMVAACRAAGYHGMGILPTATMGVGFMTPEFLKHYQVAVEEAGKLGMNMCLYDEFWFPSGSAGGLLAKKYPEALGKRLDMLATNLAGPREFVQNVPPGVFMGAVAMEAVSKKRLDISASVKEGKLAWNIPAGQWKLMVFTCVRDGAKDLVDYLSPDAVKKFIQVTYQVYYDKLSTHFGATIDSAFYDEPTFHWIQGGRAWTEQFNERFRERYNLDPVILYPALWFDIGPETAAARNALLGFRAELYSTGFPKTINDWCQAHRIRLTGHVDQEEIVNPVGLCGDLMKAFKYQDIPGIDQVFQYGRASRAYKVVSSAACNYDKPQVMVECYGAIDLMLVANLYKEAMDQFAKGINTMVPHAVWYDPAKIIFKPDLSPGSPTYGPELPAYNKYMGRLQRLLQGGRHVADIAVLYPIATLQAGYYFGPGVPYEGGVIPPEADYMDVGEMLALKVRRDFTFLHPETMSEKCRVEGAELCMANKVNFERYKVFIMPGSRVIHWSSLERIKDFYDHGGKVIATTRLPESSAEFGHDAEVQQAIAAMFEQPNPDSSPAQQFTKRVNAQGGKAYFAARPNAAALRAMLDDAVQVYDVRFEQEAQVTGGNLSYIHKVVEGRNLYFFGNSSGTAIDTPIRLRGKVIGEWWDPHTGQIRPAEVQTATEQGQEFTHARLVLPPVRSVFLVNEQLEY